MIDETRQFDAIKRKIRLISILDSAASAGLTPLPVSSLHMIAYFADVLAPVWSLPVLDSVVLKQLNRPFFPRLQADLDYLVGSGVVVVTRVGYVRADDEDVRIDADYELNQDFAAPILREVRQHAQQAETLDFVQEVVYAVSAFGLDQIPELGEADASYSDPLVDFGDLIEIADESSDGSNRSARVALRFRELGSSTTNLSDAEVVHLYVRHLYSRMQVA
jgi:hypothetical protein